MMSVKGSIICLVALAAALSAHSDTLTDLTWVGGAGADFNDPANWSPAATPGSGHRLIFDGDATPVIITQDDGKVRAGAICVLSGNVTLTKGASAPSNSRLIVSDNGASEVVLDIADGASFTANVPLYASFSGASPRTYVKKGGGRLTSNVGFVNNDSIRVEAGVLEAMKENDRALISDNGSLVIWSGATFRPLNNNALSDRAPVVVEEGGVFDLNGRIASVAGVTGSGIVTNSVVTTGDSYLSMTLFRGPYRFDGRFVDARLKVVRYGGTNVRATTEEEFGFVVSSTDALARLIGTIEWSYDSSLSNPSLQQPTNSWLRFAPGVGTFKVACENQSTTLKGYAQHPLWLEDMEGRPVTLLTRIASAHMPNIKAAGSGSLYIGGYDVTLTGDQIQIGGTLGALGGKDAGTAQTITLGDNSSAFDFSTISAIDTVGGSVVFHNVTGATFPGRVIGSKQVSVGTPLTIGELSTKGEGVKLTADLTVNSGHFISSVPSFDYAAANLTLTLNGGEFSRPYETARYVDDAFAGIPLPHSSLPRGNYNGSGTLVLNGGDFYILNNSDYGVRNMVLNGGRLHIQWSTPYKPVDESTAADPTVFLLDGGEIVASRKNIDVGSNVKQDLFEDTDRLALRVGAGGAGLTDGVIVIGTQKHESAPILIKRPFVHDPGCAGVDGGLRQRGTMCFRYLYPMQITGPFVGEGGTSVVETNASLAADNSFFGSGDTVLRNHSLKLAGRTESYSFRPHGSGKKLSVDGSAVVFLRDRAADAAVSMTIDNLDFAPGSMLFLHDPGRLGAGSSTVKLATPPQVLANGRVNLPVFGTDNIYNPCPLGYSAENGFTNLTGFGSAFGSGKIVDIATRFPTIEDGESKVADMLASPSGNCGLTLGDNASLTLGNGTDPAICHLSVGGISGGAGATLSFGTSPALIVCSSREVETMCTSFISVPIVAANGLSVVSVPDIETRGWRGVRLTEANTYSGVTRINSAIIQAEHPQCFSTGDVYATGGDKHAGGIRFNRRGAVWNNNFHLSGKGIRSTSYHRAGDLGFSMQFTADGEVAGDVEIGYIARLSASTNAAVTGVVSGTISGGKLELAYSKGTILLTGANTYSNGTDIIRSKLEVARGDSLGTGEVWLCDSTLRFVNEEPIVFSNYLKGTGTVEIAGAPVTFAGHSFDGLPVKTLAKGSVLRLTTGYALGDADVAVSTVKEAIVVDGSLKLDGDKTVSSVWGSGTVSGGALTVTDEINPSGAGTVGTLTFETQPVLSGATLTIDTKNGQVDKVVVPGALQLAQIGLRVVQVGDPVDMRPTAFLQSAGGLVGGFASVDLPPKRTRNYSVSVGANDATLCYARPGGIVIVR